MTAKSAPTAVKSGGRQGQAFKDRSKPADIRQSNINAAKGKSILVKYTTQSGDSWSIFHSSFT